MWPFDWDEKCYLENCCSMIQTYTSPILTCNWIIFSFVKHLNSLSKNLDNTEESVVIILLLELVIKTFFSSRSKMLRFLISPTTTSTLYTTTCSCKLLVSHQLKWRNQWKLRVIQMSYLATKNYWLFCFKFYIILLKHFRLQFYISVKYSNKLKYSDSFVLYGILLPVLFSYITFIFYFLQNQKTSNIKIKNNIIKLRNIQVIFSSGRFLLLMKIISTIFNLTKYYYYYAYFYHIYMLDWKILNKLQDSLPYFTAIDIKFIIHIKLRFKLQN